MLRQIPIIEPSKQPRRQPLVQPFQPDPSCVLWLLQQRDAKWYDYSGKGNHGAIHGATWKSSPAGVGMSFDSDDDYVNCGNDASLNITDAITIEAWVKPRTLIGNYEPIFRRIQGGDTIVFRFHSSDASAGKLEVFHQNYSEDYTISDSSVVILNQWQHIAWSYDGGKSKLYFNGSEIKSSDITGSSSGDITMCRIGEYGGDYFNGSIDGVKIYNRALSAEEIASIWRVERSWHGV